jgi:cytochrome b561
MLVLLTVVYVCMELRGYFPKGSDIREGMKTWHYMLGLCVPGLVISRLIVLKLSPQPAWQLHLAAGMHLALYAFMITMPILGWLTLSAAGKPIPFFGLELPALVNADKALARQIKEVHEIGSVIGYCLIGLHAAAGLFHHYLVRDNTLQRMLPWHAD